MRAFTLASLAILVGALFMVAGCNRSANLLTGNAAATAADLSSSTPIAPTSQDPFVAPSGSINVGAQQLKIEIVYQNPSGYSKAGHSVYYIGGTMTYQVRITNLSCISYDCLNITAQQQYYDTTALTTKGQALPGSPTENWKGVQLAGHSSVLLQGSYSCPLSCQPGVEQTAVQISKCNGCGSLKYYNPECGVWDPLLP